VRGVQIIVLASTLVSVYGYAKTKKTHVSVGLAITAGFRDTAWEIGNDLSIQVDTPGLNLRLRAPFYYTIAKHPRLDPFDWDEPGDYGRILDFLDVHTKGRGVMLYAGPLRNLKLGIGEISSGYFNYLSHCNVRAGARLKADVDFIGADVVISNVVRPLDLIMADIFFRPMYSLGGVLRHFRFEAQLAMTKPVSGDLYRKYGFGLHAPVYENKAFSIGLDVFIRKNIYTFAAFSNWKTRRVSGSIQVGLRVSNQKVNTPWAGPFFSIDRHYFLGSAPKKQVIDKGDYQWDRIGVAAGFFRFSMKVKGILDVWGIVDIDTRKTAIYAAGMGLTMGPVRANASFAVRGDGHEFMYSAEARWMFYGPLFLTAQGSQSYDYDSIGLQRVNVLMAGIGAILKW